MEEFGTKLIGDMTYEGTLGKEVTVSVYDPMYVETNTQGGLDISLIQHTVKSKKPLAVKLNIKAEEISFEGFNGDLMKVVDNLASIAIIPEEYRDRFLFTEFGFRYVKEMEISEYQHLGADSAAYVVEVLSKDVNLDTYTHFDTGADGFYGSYRTVTIDGKPAGLIIQVSLGTDMMSNQEFNETWKYILGIK